MKKIIIITLVVVLLLVGLIWGYLMVFGTPTSAGDVFADLGIGDANNREFEASETTDERTPTNEIVAPDSKNLKLLSLRTTAGSVILGSSTADQVVRMVEQGTGHIYDINPKTNQETRVSGTTYAGITNAYLSPDGSYAVLLANKAVGRSVHLVSLGSTTEAKLLPSDASEFGFSESGQQLYYVRSDRNGSIGYTYNIKRQQDSVLFSVPFLAISVLWDENPIIYNRPGENYPGYIYEVGANSTLETLTTGGTNLTAFRHNDTILVNRVVDGFYKAHIVTPGSADITFDSIAALPEKCTGSKTTSIIWCAYPTSPNIVGKVPMEWYKGTVSLSDGLWTLDTTSKSLQLVSKLEEEAGRPLDVVEITANQSGTALVFTDKNTNTLWYFDTTVE